MVDGAVVLFPQKPLPLLPALEQSRYGLRMIILLCSSGEATLNYLVRQIQKHLWFVIFSG